MLALVAGGFAFCTLIFALYFTVRKQFLGAHPRIPKVWGWPLIGSLTVFFGGPPAVANVQQQLGNVFQLFILGEWMARIF